MSRQLDTAEVEGRVRELLAPADPVTQDAGPDGAVLERILGEGPRARRGRPRTYRPPRRRWVIGVALVGVLGVGGLAAEATGVIPGDVDWGLNRAGDTSRGAHGLAPDTDKAEMLFSGVTPDGLTMQYWEAPNESGGTCHYLRVLGPDGKRMEGGWSECSRGGDSMVSPPAPMWSVVDTTALSDWVAIYGRAPKGAVSVKVDWHGKNVVGPIDVGRDRYFLTFLPYNSRSNEEWFPEYRTQAFDAHGRVLGVVRSEH